MLGGGEQDPYVKLCLRPRADWYTTPVLEEGGSNPRWDDKGRMLVEFADTMLPENTGVTPVAVLEVWDRNPSLAGDTIIGAMQLPLFPFIMSAGHMAAGWYPLRHGKKGEYAGELQVQCGV